jgi:hypothetical protein
MKKILLVILFIDLNIPVSHADCIEIDGRQHCDKGACVEANGSAYCSTHENGVAVIHNGAAYCGAGACIEKEGNIYCSQFPGGGIIENNGGLWTGKGECLIHNGNVYCANETGGKCFIEDNSVKCQGGWMREKAEKALRCHKTVGIN